MANFNLLSILIIHSLIFASQGLESYYISTYAGSGGYGASSDGVVARGSPLYNTYGVWSDTVGKVYLSENNAAKIRTVSTSGILGTLAGGGSNSAQTGGPATSVALSSPYGVWGYGNILYFADQGYFQVFAVNIATGVISLFGGMGSSIFMGDGVAATSSNFYYPYGICGDGTNIYVATVFFYRVLKVSNSIVTTFAGNGNFGSSSDGAKATSVSLGYVYGLSCDTIGNVHVGESYYRIRKINSGGIISTFVGTGSSISTSDGLAATSSYVGSEVHGIWVDTIGNVYYSDYSSYKAKVVASASGLVTTFVGTGGSGTVGNYGPATSASLYCPSGLYGISTSTMYIAEACNYMIRALTIAQPPTPIPTSIPTATSTVSIVPTVIPTCKPTYTPVVAPSFYALNLFVGSTSPGNSGDGGPASSASLPVPYYYGSVFVDSQGSTYVSDGYYRVRKVSLAGIISTYLGSTLSSGVNSGDGGPATSAYVAYPSAVWADSIGGVFVMTPRYAIRKVDSASIVTTYAGTGSSGSTGDGGQATAAKMSLSFGLTGDSMGNIYFSDRTSYKIRMVDTSGIVTTIAGTGSPGYGGEGVQATASTIYTSVSIASDGAGNLYFNENMRVRKCSSMTLTTVAGMTSSGSGGADGVKATSSTFYNLLFVWVDSLGTVLISDTNNYKVKMVVSTLLYTVAGTGDSSLSSTSGLATSSSLSTPYGIGGDTSGNLLVYDYYVVRKLTPVVPTVMPTPSPTSPTVSPTLAPTVSPTMLPTTRSPTVIPANAPTRSPSVKPTSLPTVRPSCWPSEKPSTLPTVEPSLLPSEFPSVSPSDGPTVVPSIVPSLLPTLSPSRGPTMVPTVKPSLGPSVPPSVPPTMVPTVIPSVAPSVLPTVKPSLMPTVSPSVLPTAVPTVLPSIAPTFAPSLTPTSSPSEGPTLLPTVRPSLMPTLVPTVVPSVVPSLMPTDVPTVLPSVLPSVLPTVEPSLLPTVMPSSPPSVAPSIGPSVEPTAIPTVSPSVAPSQWPTQQPTIGPTISPTFAPSVTPTIVPSEAPSESPSIAPSTSPSVAPFLSPSVSPSAAPSEEPTESPTENPTISSSLHPSVAPSVAPSTAPSMPPSVHPSDVPTLLPSVLSTRTPSVVPSELPTLHPTAMPTLMPTVVPTVEPTIGRSVCPSAAPSVAPSVTAAVHPSVAPLASPSNHLTDVPTLLLPMFTTVSPSLASSEMPIDTRTECPSIIPAYSRSPALSVSPSSLLTVATTADPSGSIHPTSTPTVSPSAVPSIRPTMTPSSSTSLVQTVIPSLTSVVPSTNPSWEPSLAPSAAMPVLSVATSIPSLKPTRTPTFIPSLKPTRSPTLQVTLNPTAPTATPSLTVRPVLSEEPSVIPSVAPTASPSAEPVVAPSRPPTIKPSVMPSKAPSTSLPITTSPTAVPSTLEFYMSHPRATLPSNRSISVIGDSEKSFKIVLSFLAVSSGSFGDVFSDIALTTVDSILSYLLLGSNMLRSTMITSELTSHGNSGGYDSSKRSVSVLGDINDDGYSDLIIGDPYLARCFVMFGSQLGFANMTVGFTIFGESEGDLTGWSVSGAGDVNNDTLADIIVGAPFVKGVGAVYVIYGKRFNNFNVYLNNLTSSQGFVVYGSQKSDLLGISVSNAGDVNGDGCNDIIIGGVITSSYFAGAAYIVYGSESVRSMTTQQLSPLQGYKLTGESYGYYGYSVSAAGDVNKDGLGDVLIGSSPQRSSLVPTTYLVYGSKSVSGDVSLVSLTSSQGVRITGGGSVVSCAGDVNRDGFDDVLIGQVPSATSLTGYIVYFNVSLMTGPSTSPSIMPVTNRNPTRTPSRAPRCPTVAPSKLPSIMPSLTPTAPTDAPTPGGTQPSSWPSALPSNPTVAPSAEPTPIPSIAPSEDPTEIPTIRPTESPSEAPSVQPTRKPSGVPSEWPSIEPSTLAPTVPSQTRAPFSIPTLVPTVVSSLTTLTSFYIQGATVLNQTQGYQNYIVNTSENVSIYNIMGHNKYTIYPYPGSRLTIQYLNSSNDVIDLTTFHVITEFKQILISEGSVILTLPSTQVVHIVNLHPPDISKTMFLFYKEGKPNLKHDSKSTETLSEVAAVLIVAGGLILGSLMLLRWCNGGWWLRKMTMIPDKNTFLMEVVYNAEGKLIEDAEENHSDEDSGFQIDDHDSSNCRLY